MNTSTFIETITLKGGTFELLLHLYDGKNLIAYVELIEGTRLHGVGYVEVTTMAQGVQNIAQTISQQAPTGMYQNLECWPVCSFSTEKNGPVIKTTFDVTKRRNRLIMTKGTTQKAYDVSPVLVKSWLKIIEQAQVRLGYKSAKPLLDQIKDNVFGLVLDFKSA